MIRRFARLLTVHVVLFAMTDGTLRNDDVLSLPVYIPFTGYVFVLSAGTQTSTLSSSPNCNFISAERDIV